MVSIYFRDSEYSNNSAISMTEFRDIEDVLVCHTTFKKCCTTSDGGINLGKWIYPDGTFVPSSVEGNSFYRSGISGGINLHRNHNLTSVSGIFTCEIPISDSRTESLHIFLYSGELPGNVII